MGRKALERYDIPDLLLVFFLFWHVICCKLHDGNWQEFVMMFHSFLTVSLLPMWVTLHGILQPPTCAELSRVGFAFAAICTVYAVMAVLVGKALTVPLSVRTCAKLRESSECQESKATWWFSDTTLVYLGGITQFDIMLFQVWIGNQPR